MDIKLVNHLLRLHEEAVEGIVDVTDQSIITSILNASFDNTDPETLYKEPYYKDTTWKGYSKDGKIVGIIGTYKGGLVSIAVLPEYRKQGISTKLLNAVPIDHGFVRTSNLAAQSALRKAGLKRAPGSVATSAKYPDGESSILFRGKG